MTIVVSNKQRIYYRFEGDKGAYLLLHHGLFGSHRDWYDAGYVEALRNEFRLIVPDARGHGRSDHPLEPSAYRLEAFAEDVITIMDELDIRNLHFCGYALGALVGFELLMRHPERMRIVMLAGESPFISEPMQAEWRRSAEAIRLEGLNAARERLRVEQRLTAGAFGPEQEGEQAAALALLEGLAAAPVRPDDGRISVNSPVALFTGEADPALGRMREARRRIHRARFVSFPGQSHAGLFRERTALTREILRLLRPGPRPGEGGSEGEAGAREPSGRGDRGQRPTENEPGRQTSAPLTPPPPVEVQERPEPGKPALAQAPDGASPREDAAGAPAPAGAAESAAPPAAAAQAHDPHPPQDARTLPPVSDFPSGPDELPGPVTEAAPGPAVEPPAAEAPADSSVRARPEEGEEGAADDPATASHETQRRAIDDSPRPMDASEDAPAEDTATAPDEPEPDRR